jgi:hypothetical protein
MDLPTHDSSLIFPLAAVLEIALVGLGSVVLTSSALVDLRQVGPDMRNMLVFCARATIGSRICALTPTLAEVIPLAPTSLFRRGDVFVAFLFGDAWSDVGQRGDDA